MRKKLVAIVLAGMMAASLAACGGSNSSSSSKSASSDAKAPLQQAHRVLQVLRLQLAQFPEICFQ